MGIKSWLISQSTKREPDMYIGGKEDPYLKRWYLIPRNEWFNIYLHNILHSDDDRALHDHPSFNISWLLDGSYVEHMPGIWGDIIKKRKTGAIIFRTARSAHRLEIIPGQKPVWTLWISGPKYHHWGFYCPQGFRIWEEFVSTRDKGSVGKGCGE